MAGDLDSYLSTATASNLGLTTSAAGATSGAAFTTQPVVAIQDSLGNTVTGSSAVVTMTVSDNGTVVETATETASSGVATFSTVGISGTAGTAYTLTFASTGLTSVTQSITPTAGTASQLALSTSAAGSISGAAFTTQPVVVIRDTYGNTVTGSSAVVTMTVSDNGTVVETATETASSGVATFSTVGISGTAGTSYTLTFASTGLTSATQSITPTAGAAATIAVNGGDNQSATVATAVTAAPSVKVTDAQGNAVSGVSVTFAVASGSGSLASTGAVTTDSTGIATSPAWTLGAIAGANTLTATSAGLTGSPLTISATGTAGTASKLFLSQDALVAVPGAAFSIQPEVAIQDAAGNTVTTDFSSVVTMTVGDNGTVVGTATARALNGVAIFSDVGISGTIGTVYTLTFSSRFQVLPSANLG